MDRSRTTETTRKPPSPSEDHSIIEQWLKRVMPDLHPIVKHLDELFCQTLPGLQFAIKWGKVYYGLPKLGWVIELVAYDVSVNIVFLGGADFNAPPPLGTADCSRYVKLRSLEEAQGAEVRGWVEEAGRVPGWV